MSDFKNDPRGFALEIAKNSGWTRTVAMLEMALNFMSKDDVREMLDSNELSPRFLEEDLLEVLLEEDGF